MEKVGKQKSGEDRDDRREAKDKRTIEERKEPRDVSDSAQREDPVAEGTGDSTEAEENPKEKHERNPRTGKAAREKARAQERMTQVKENTESARGEETRERKPQATRRLELTRKKHAKGVAYKKNPIHREAKRKRERTVLEKTRTSHQARKEDTRGTRC